MSGLGGPTPRRSGRLSSRAGSVIEQSVVTTYTSGGARQRNQGPLTKVKARRSNAYGASGRVGAAEELSVSATGFAQAFQNQRGDAVARDDDEEDEEEEEDDSVGELGSQARMSGALNGSRARRSPIHERSSPPRIVAPYMFDTPDVPFSGDDLAFSLGSTSKSFGMEHEAGMLQDNQRRTAQRSSSQQPTPVPRSTFRPVGQSTRLLPSTKAAPDKVAIDESIEDLLAEERARLQRDGPGRSRLAPRPAPRLAPTPEIRHAVRPEARVEPRPEPRPEAHPQPRVARQPEPQAQPGIQLRHPGAVQQMLGHVEPFEEFFPEELLEDEPEWPWRAMVERAYWALLIAGGIVLLFSTLLHRIPDANSKVAMHTAVGTRLSQSWYDLADWIMPGRQRYNDTDMLQDWLHEGDTTGDHLVWARVWKNHREYTGKFDAMHGAIEKIQEELPELVVVRRYPDGHREITDDFWNALLSKAQAKGDDAEWVEFLRANSQKVQALDGEPVDVGKPAARPEIVHRREFMDMMGQHYKTVSADVDQKILESFKTHEPKIKSLIQAEVRKTSRDFIRLESLAQSNLVASYELNLKKPNYLSTGLGAIIEPGRTSSTFHGGSPWLAKLVKSSMRGATANPPKAALTKWEEFGDCWCAAPNPMKGYARLGISLSRHMFPKQVTVEHAPVSMSPTGNVNNAPRNIELWAETDQPIKQHYGQSHNKCLDPADLQRHGYVCLGTFKYNIHGSNHVQTFDLDAELSVPTSRIIVQVTSNWGAPNTCLYRVRLHGDDAEENYNYDVTLND